MIESPEDITFALEMAGEVLNFGTFSIMGIPGDLVYNVQDYSSPNDLEKQEVNFQISYKDFMDKLIDTKDTFIYSLPNTNASTTYRIEAYTADTTGWVNLLVSPIAFT